MITVILVLAALFSWIGIGVIFTLYKHKDIDGRDL